MKTGTKSLLFGHHQFILHPILVWMAWVYLYKEFPPFRVVLAIIIHDWGYWGSEKMDDEYGERHAERSARIMVRLDRIFDFDLYYDRNGNGWLMEHLVEFHSRFQAKRWGCHASPLCLADKASILLMPDWLCIFLGWLSGEVREYMTHQKYEINHGVDLSQDTRRSWLKRYKNICRKWITGEVPLEPWTEENDDE
jgi:hypothetical protein